MTGSTAEMSFAELIRPTGIRGAVENRADDFGVIVFRHDHAINDIISTNDAGCGNLEVQHRITGGRKLMHHLESRCATVENTFIPIFEDDHESALDAVVIGLDSSSDEIGEIHISDEAAALVDLEHGFITLFPVGNSALPHSTPVSTPMYGSGSVSANAPRQISRSSPG